MPLIGNDTWTIQSHHFQWPWLTLWAIHRLQAYSNGTIVQQLTRFQLTSSVARFLCNRRASYRIISQNITPALRELHWLPVKFRIQFKPAVFMHQASTQRCPSYVADLVDFCASDPQRRSLRSASTCAAVIRRTRTELGRRAFAVSGVWNSLPPSLRNMTSHSAFRRSLKTHFYKLAFLSWFYWLCNARSVDFFFVWTRTIKFRM